MREIPLTQGEVARVSERDYRGLSQFRWYAVWCSRSHIFYARRREGDHHIYMHRQILGAQGGQKVDHKDHVGTHNERENIRISTTGQNAANQVKRATNQSSRFKGVTWQSSRQRWYASIQAGGIKMNLGRYIIEEDAARAYDAAARKYFGAFACCNLEVSTQ